MLNEEFIYYFWVFIFGSFLGFLLETVFCIVKNKKIESRKGLIYGFLSQVYGFAITIITYIINTLSITNYIHVFIIGLIICSTSEYLCSFFQEKIFGAISWDYKDFKFNLNGRINLNYSLFFAAAILIWYIYGMPFITNTINYFKGSIFNIVTLISICLLIYDCIISFLAVYRQKERRNNIEANNIIRKFLDKNYPDTLLNKIYANTKPKF